VQVLLSPEVRVVGLQFSEERVGPPRRFSVADLETPLIVAVTEAV